MSSIVNSFVNDKLCNDQLAYDFITRKFVLKVAVGPKRSTNRNLKQIITIECTKTAIFQLLRPIDISKLANLEHRILSWYTVET